MPSIKDKAFHANGKMTAAEYKRRFLNKMAVSRASAQVEVRTNVGQMKGVAKAVKNRLRNVTIRTEPMPGDFYKPSNQGDESVMRKHSNRSHIVTSF